MKKTLLYFLIGFLIIIFFSIYINPIIGAVCLFLGFIILLIDEMKGDGVSKITENFFESLIDFFDSSNIDKAFKLRKQVDLKDAELKKMKGELKTRKNKAKEEILWIIDDKIEKFD
jgi:hypothetical protein